MELRLPRGEKSIGHGDGRAGLAQDERRAESRTRTQFEQPCSGEIDPVIPRRYLQIAMRSASELEYHLLYAQDVGLLNESSYREFTSNVTEVKRMLASLIKKLNAES